MKARTFVLVFGLIELGMGVAGMMGVAHFAHLGGMLGGWLMIRYWRGQPVPAPSALVNQRPAFRASRTSG
jgi:membrane associated rhomboid family serine protease